MSHTLYLIQPIIYFAAFVCVGEASRWRPLVGLEVTMNHLRGAPIGTAIIATAVPLRVGTSVQVRVEVFS